MKQSELKLHLNICIDLFQSHTKYKFKMPIYINRHSHEDLGTWHNVFINDKMSHYISINTLQMQNITDLHSTILHELVHAMQYETTPDNTEHNELFLKYVVLFGKLGYNLSCIDFTEEQLLNAFY